MGNAFGTHPGALFASIVSEGGQLKIEGRLNHNDEILSFSGKLPDTIDAPGVISFAEFGAPENTSAGTLTLRNVTPTLLEGEWTSETGGQGVFHITKTRMQSQGGTGSSNTEIELVASSVNIGPVQLFRPELLSLIEKIQSFFPNPIRGNLIVSTDPGYKEAISQFVDVFIQSSSLPHSINNLKLQLADTSTPIHRIAIVELHKNGETSILVQSGDRIWTHGAREALETHLRRHRSRFRRIFSNDTFSLNALLFTLALILLPDMSFWQRVIFMIVVFTGLVITYNVQRKLKTNAIFLDDTKRDALQTYRSNIIMGVTAIVVGAAITLAASLIQYYWPLWFPLGPG